MRDQPNLIDADRIIVKFSVPGRARPQGSKNVGKFGQMYELVKGLKEWRRTVSGFARAYFDNAPVKGPCRLRCDFYFERPRSHFTSKPGVLRKNVPDGPNLRCGDLSKLVRAVEDALTGVVWVDDVQEQELVASKQWGDSDVAFITVESI